MDYEEVDRLKNELDKSERCRQTLELRFAEIREEAERSKALMVSQAKEMEKQRDQIAEYRSKYHNEQDRGDYYKKDLDKLCRDLKDIDKLANSLGKSVTESLDRFKKTATDKSKSGDYSKQQKAKDTTDKLASPGNGNGGAAKKGGSGGAVQVDLQAVDANCCGTSLDNGIDLSLTDDDDEVVDNAAVCGVASGDAGGTVGGSGDGQADFLTATTTMAVDTVVGAEPMVCCSDGDDHDEGHELKDDEDEEEHEEVRCCLIWCGLTRVLCRGTSTAMTTD